MSESWAIAAVFAVVGINCWFILNRCVCGRYFADHEPLSDECPFGRGEEDG